MSDKKEIAVVLLNLGGPDKRESIRPFLFNFFMDPNIIGLPKPFRWLLSKYISISRSRKEAGDSYAALGNKSPLLENTQAQADALSAVLGDEFKVHIAMRYWHPFTHEAARQVKDDHPDQVIILPLYPQFSTTTTWSSLQEWQKASKKFDIDIPTSLICCYPTDPGFIGASAELVKTHYLKACTESKDKGLKPPRVLFSAHGLPEDIIRKGDPYQWQCEKAAERIAETMGIENLDWQICYQSRVGPKKWIGPSTEDALEKAVADDVPVLIYPHAFVSEHVETLVEIEEEYRELAEEMGVPGFHRVPTVSVHETFINGLAALVRSRVGQPGIAPDKGARICPAGFNRCCMGMDVALYGAQSRNAQAPEVAA